MRLFIAIELAPSIQDSLHKITTQFHQNIKGRWVEQHNLHITVGFIGEVNDSSLPALINNLVSMIALVKPFDFVIDKIISLPSKQPRLLALSVKYPAQYKLLQKNVTAAVLKSKLRLQTHDPHITLVRLKEREVRLPDIDSLNLKFEVREISLMKSILSPKGPIYQRLKGLKLASGTPSALLRPNIAICVINPKNEVLLVQHREHTKHYWQFPQGGIIKGDKLEDTIYRELREELGLEKFSILKVRKNIYRYRWPDKLIKQGQDLNKQGYVGQEQSLAIVQVPEIRPKLVPDPREAANVRWFNLTKVMVSLNPVRRPMGRLAVVELNKLITNNNSNG